MKNAIKVLCFVIVFCITLGAAGYFYYVWGKTDFNFIDGTEKNCITITEYKGNSKIIEIPNRIRGKKVTAIDDNAFLEKDITEVKIGNNVVTLGNSVFEKCKSLKKVTLGKSLVSIGNYCFNECTSLEEITIPATVKKIGLAVFNADTALKNVIFEDGGNFLNEDGIVYDSAKETLMVALPYAKVTDFVCPTSVKNIQSFAFAGHTELKTFKYSSAVSRLSEGTFLKCTSLKSLELPNGMLAIDNMCCTGSGVESIKIPNSVTDISKTAFYEMKNLTIIAGKNTAASRFAQQNNIKNSIV